MYEQHDKGFVKLLAENIKNKRQQKEILRFVVQKHMLADYSMTLDYNQKRIRLLKSW